MSEDDVYGEEGEGLGQNESEGGNDNNEQQSLEELKEQLVLYENQLEENKDSNDEGLIEQLQLAIQLTRELIDIKQKEEEEKHNTKPIFNIGDFCYGLYEGLWYVAVITKIIDNTKKNKQQEDNKHKKPNFEYAVRYVGYGNHSILSKERYNIKEYQNPPLDFIQPGMKCYAVDNNDIDGPYYEAVIDKPVYDKETVWVVFKPAGVIQEVPLKHIRLISHEEFYDPKYKLPKAKESSATITNIGVTSSSTSAGVTTANISGKSTVDAEMIAKKKKKQEKRKKKHEEREKELNQKKASWQSFMSKNTNAYKSTGKSLERKEREYTPQQKKVKHTK
ncbi:hypothetical protein ABK040_002992 [Willaertia magna]